jgi:uncharacterized protein (DUF433 family)
MATFFSYNALVSQRAAGYKNTAYALAELIDNSFDANAHHVHVILMEKNTGGRRKVEEILVLDDGDGMSPKVLQGALQFGNTTNSNIDDVVKTRRKGKFGYGLPNASLSQCQNIGVYSWQKKKKVNFVYLDLEELKKTESIEIPAVKEQDLPSEFEEILGKLSESGTLVTWKHCDRLSHIRGDSIIRNSSDILGRLYRHLLAEGKSIAFSIFEYMPNKHRYIQQGITTNLRPNDPLFLMKDTVMSGTLWAESISGGAVGKAAEHYEKFVLAPDKCLPTNTQLVDYCHDYEFRWKGKVYVFHITTSVVLPDIQMPGQSRGGSTDVGKWYGNKEAIGNISFVRADREIASGHFGGFYNRTVLEQRFWSIEVKFDADADDLLGVHNNKQGIEFTCMNKDQGEDEFDEHTADLLQARNQCWIQLTEKISSAIKAAFKVVKKQSTDWHAANITVGGGQAGTPTIPTGTPTTSGTIRKVEGQRPQILPPLKRKELEERLIAKYPNLLEADVIAAIDALDKSLTRACVLYAPTESKQLWSYTKVYDIVVVLVNTQHEFYSKVLSELRINGQDGALTAIELLLSSLAIEEEAFIHKENEKEIIEVFRELVGTKLHRYMIGLSQEISMMNTLHADLKEDE